MTDSQDKYNQKHNRFADKEGFTLIELMIASAIFVVGIVAAMQSYVSSNNLRIDAEQRTTVYVRTHTVMDEIYRAELGASDEPGTLLGYVPPEFDGFPTFDIDIVYLDGNGTLVSPPLVGVEDLPNPLQVFVTTTSTYLSGREETLTTASIVRR